MRYLYLFVFLSFWSSVASAQNPEVQLPVTPANTAADILITGGTIYTADDANPITEAAAIKKGRYIWLGKKNDAASYIDDNTQVIDLSGATAFPGFINTYLPSGETLELPLSSYQSLKNTIVHIRGWLASYQAPYIIGNGWNEENWREKRLPSRWDLDLISQTIPIIWWHKDGQTAVVNSYALDLLLHLQQNSARLTFHKNALNELTGLITGLYKADFSALISPETKAQHLVSTTRFLQASGWTILLTDKAINSRNETPSELGLSNDTGNDMPAKRMIYLNGISVTDNILTTLQEALYTGSQVNLANMDSAAGLTLYREAFNTVPEIERAVLVPRWRMTNPLNLTEEAVYQMTSLGVLPTLTPPFTTIAEPGQKNLMETLLSAGRVTIGSGNTAYTPQQLFHAALMATNESSEHSDRSSLLKMFTLWGAYASFQERELGSIEVGKAADLTAFNADLMQDNPADIRQAKTVLTIIGGSVLHHLR